MAKVLVVTNDVLGERMAGPAIRAWEISKALSRKHEVTLASYSISHISHDKVKLVIHEHSDEKLKMLAYLHDAVVLQPYVLSVYHSLGQAGKPLIMDMYDPYILENFEMNKGFSALEREERYKSTMRVLSDEIMAGDYFICASPRQKDFWAGMMVALGRVNPVTYDRTPSLDGFLDVVPFGIDPEPPASPGRPVLKGVVPGIGADDKVLIWGGGIWNWFDTKTLVRAMALVAKTRPDIKLFFLGMVHPNPAMPDFQMKNARETLALAEELGLAGKSVLFNKGWVPYRDRGAYLLEADAGVTTHYNHLETSFSFRTRVLDYLWAGLPVISTVGDHMAELVEKEHFGATVPYEDPKALKDAILSLLDNKQRMQECSNNAKKMAESFHWDRICAPLVEYLNSPVAAPDKNLHNWSIGSSINKSIFMGGRLFTYLFREGARGTLRRITHYLRKER